MNPRSVVFVILTLMVLAALLLVEASRQGHRELDRCMASAPMVDSPSMVSWEIDHDYARFRLICTLLDSNDPTQRITWTRPLWEWPP